MGFLDDDVEKAECDVCGRKMHWRRIADQGTAYGCKSYEDPEPLDPETFCHRCSRNNYRDTVKKLNSLVEKGIYRAHRSYYEIPGWYAKAIKDAGWYFHEHDVLFGNPPDIPF